jgi:murein DD-endopeptidase MepM/ murein hydrolase activator NlpD
MRKLLFTVLAAVLLFSLVIHPKQGYTSAQSDIDDALAKVKKQEAEMQKKREEVKQQSAVIGVTKDQEEKNMQQLLADINKQANKLDELNKQIDDVTLTVHETGVQLEDAVERVKSRDVLLKSRLRLMYMNGSVSYMDVLFSATSFSDFLDRFLALQSVVGQDKQILEKNKADRETVATKKEQVDTQLAEIQSLAVKAEAVKDTLSNQEGKKEVLIASLTQNLQQLDESNEEAEKKLVALAAQRAELNKKKKALADSFKYSGGKLLWPVPGKTTIGDGFGYRIDPIKHVRKLHKGIDIPAPKGTTIVAAESGVVLIASEVNGYGNTVVIDHGGGIWTWYGHIRIGGIMVKEGQKVTRGQKIAEVGSTGDSTGNHLHFEVRKNQEAVPPLPYLQQ